jgi:hypothetical protein
MDDGCRAIENVARRCYIPVIVRLKAASECYRIGGHFFDGAVIGQFWGGGGHHTGRRMQDLDVEQFTAPAANRPEISAGLGGSYQGSAFSSGVP